MISDTLALIGLIIALAFLGSKAVQRIGVPQVVGFILVGALLGTSFLNIIPLELTRELTFISEIALGLIGFDIGGHLRFEELRRLGKSIAAILLCEALGTSLVVGAGVYLITGSDYTALLFGALASATAPAATVDVLAEYKAEGPLTTTLLAIVGLDDAVSLFLFSVAAALTESLLAHTGGPSLLTIVELPAGEIGGAILVGAIAGLLLHFVLDRLQQQHDAMAMSVALVLFCAGLARWLGLSLILTTMTLGLTVVNLSPENSRHIRFTIEQAGPVIYVLFFALVGARLQIKLLPQMGLLGVAYIVLRSSGKFAGAWLGGLLGRAERVVRDNLGLGLLSQAGVAIGLALSAATRFDAHGPAGQELGALIINVITATTFVVQIIGPIFVKQAIVRAGEAGRASEEEWG